MKPLVRIGVFLGMALMVACSPKSVIVEPVERPCRELEEIDSLMWQRPDSALAVMMEFAASSKADSLNEFEGHYCQLLISELLYKNDYGQSNREELLKAVCYFDSLVMANGRDESEHDRNVFLDARAHYINGVGYYEHIDMVSACSEYLNALEVMEGHFEEKALTGDRAVFTFYNYNRLLELFSDQFMMDPAITCGEKALSCCQNEPSLFNEIPNTYFYIGTQFDKKGEKDLASCYYRQAIEGLSDTNNLVYRDAVTIKALCDYQAGHSVDSSIFAIRRVLVYASGEKEKLTRFLTLGGIFTVEESFDSALYYLEPVFENQYNVSLKIQAAEYLLINYDHLGDKEKSDECIHFLSSHKKTEGETKALVSKLEDLFKNYMDKTQKKEAEAERRRFVRKTVRIAMPVAIMLVLAIIILAKLKSKKLLKEQQA